MAKNAPLTEDEAQELFSELDDSGVIDPLLAHRRVRGGDATKADDEARREDVQVGLNLRRARRAKVDPLSEQDPSGSKAGEAISRTAILCIVGVLLFVVGMQIKVLAGLAVLVIVIQSFPMVSDYIFGEMKDVITQVIHLFTPK